MCEMAPLLLKAGPLSPIKRGSNRIMKREPKWLQNICREKLHQNHLKEDISYTHTWDVIREVVMLFRDFAHAHYY